MEKKFLHIYIQARWAFTQKMIDEAMMMNNKCDWYRYAEGVYLVHTNLTINECYMNLQPFGNSIFIAELNIDNIKGWMPNDFGDFINTVKRKQKNG
ncbi:MAG: hypothetical protein MUC49_02105 [Raineya sp.]|jgi:hypothetical protein|nr:hypothetical protein [Raineya sp.]